MRLTVDTNPIISGLLRDSTCRRVLLCEKFEFNSPQTVIMEIRKYWSEIRAKAGYSEKEMEDILGLILSNVKIIPTDNLRPYAKQAESIIGKIDENDSQFVAACLATNSEGIWTFDRHFERQSTIRVFKIEELLEIV